MELTHTRAPLLLGPGGTEVSAGSKTVAGGNVPYIQFPAQMINFILTALHMCLLTERGLDDTAARDIPQQRGQTCRHVAPSPGRMPSGNPVHCWWRHARVPDSCLREGGAHPHPALPRGASQIQRVPVLPARLEGGQERPRGGGKRVPTPAPKITHPGQGQGSHRWPRTQQTTASHLTQGSLGAEGGAPMGSSTEAQPIQANPACVNLQRRLL